MSASGRRPPGLRLPRRIAITGTDTGVGKTFVGAHIARAWKLRGYKVSVAKPVESGLAMMVGCDSDAEILARASDDPGPLPEISPYRFAAAVTPVLAAVEEDVDIDASIVRQCIRNTIDAGDVTIVEGAGGLLVPLAHDLTLRDVARENALSLLIVVGNRLGCINHTLLTVEAAVGGGCDVCGLVLCTTDREPDASRSSNRKLIESLCHVPILFDLPYIEPQWFWTGLDDRARSLVDPLIARNEA